MLTILVFEIKERKSPENIKTILTIIYPNNKIDVL
jgi:hypothetical protein